MRWNQSCGAGEEVLLVNEREVAERLTAARCVEAVEGVFRELGLGAVPAPRVLSLHAEAGAFHIKAALAGGYFVAKVNANYPGNPSVGLPTIQGVLALFETKTGRLLALMDSAELTARRTGAATGVAVKYLALEKPMTVTLVGCGRQARSQIESVAAVRPIERLFLCDADPATARSLAVTLSDVMDAEVVLVESLFNHTRESDVVITCTPSRSAYLTQDALRPGCLVAAVGADNPHKQEIVPELMARSRVVVDLLEQCVVLGDLHHAIAAGVMSAGDVHAELGDVVSGRRPGRTAESDVIVFDSTGIALQDVAAAIMVYRSDQ
ncbi:MAG: ornithine cyclodeaminase family protein [Gemmatimonadota bacterium]